MYRIILLLVAFVFVISCKEEKKASTSTTAAEKSTTKTTEESTTTTPKDEEVVLSTDKDELLSITIAYFKNCKKASTSRNDCRNNSTKMIAEFYNITDFKNTNGDYVIFDSIQPMVNKSDNWIKLGKASNQEVLTKAQEAANNGNATIAIDVSESYGEVAMIIPGNLTNSLSWKLNVPNTAMLVNYDAEKSFMNQPLSYAFKSTENIVLFTKK